MLISILILILMIAAVAGLALYPGRTKKQNGVVAVVSAMMLFFCYAVFCVWISDRLTGRVRMGAVLLFLLLFTAVLWSGIWKRRRVQHFFWRPADVAGIGIVLIFACWIACHVFTPYLWPQYGTAVGAKQFLSAMRLQQYGSSGGAISFSAAVETFFIGVLAPFLPETAAIQAFIAAEVFLRLLEAGVFYVAVLSVSEQKIVRYAAPVFGICYFFGYPALSLLWANYEYWNDGALLFLFGIGTMLSLAKERRAGVPELLRAAGVMAALICCGGQYAAFFAPALSFAVTGLLAFRFANRDAGAAETEDDGSGKDTTGPSGRKRRRAILSALLVCDLLAAAWFWQRFFVLLDGVAAGSAETAGIYRCMYGDLLFFVPALLFVAAYAFWRETWNKERTIVAGVCGAALLVAIIVLYVHWYRFSLDTYYYFLNYYVLWAAGWLLAVTAFALMARTKQLPMFFSYLGMIAAIGALTLTNYDFKMWHHNIDYNQPGVTKNFFSLYRQSMDGLLEDYGSFRLPEGFFAAVSEAAASSGTAASDGAAASGRTQRTAVVTADEALQCWGDGLLGAASDGYRLDRHEFPEVIRTLTKDQADRIIVPKSEESYGYFAEYYRYCPVVYENEDAAVYGAPEGGWAENDRLAAEYPAAKQELFSFVAEHCAGETVPLMADRSAYLDYIMYENLTGTNSSEFYTWHFMPVDNLKNLNAHGVTMIVLLNEDEYYQSTRDYLDRQVVVFENEAGRVLACDGPQWATQY